MAINFPVRYQNIGAIVLIFLSLIIYFRAVVFEGKTFLASDTIASHSWETIVKDASAEGIFPLWNPYIFCGMPGFASLSISGARTYDFITYGADQVRSALGYLFVDHDLGIYIFFYWVFGVGMYFFATKKLHNRAVALFTAFGGMYSMYMIILVTSGHMTKIAVIAWFPFVFLIIDNLRDRFRWIEAIGLVLFLRLMFAPSHIQYLFYIGFALGLYLLFFLVRSFVAKEEWKPVVRAAIVLAVATIMAFSMGADQYLSTIEYTPYSIRGANPITELDATSQTKTADGGLDYTYATNWSLAPGELMTFFIPSWYGFGSSTYDGILTQNRTVPINTYWGPQPFTEAPNYFGVIILVFAIVGFARNRRDPFVQYLGVTTIVAILISFGREFPLVYDLLYKFVPPFNRFRIPSMILMLLQFTLPLLAGYGIMSLAGDALTPERRKRWKYGFIALGVLLALSLVGRGIVRGLYEGIFPPAEVLGQRYQPSVIGELYNYVFTMMTNDLAVAAALLLIAFGALYYFIQERMKFTTLIAVLLVVSVFDLWRIDSRPLHPQPRADKEELFATPEYVKYLQLDKSLYRVLEFENGQPPYSNILAYWRIQSAYGYQGVKMRWYQDMVDVAGLQNPLVWQLMNVKYIITNQPDSAKFLGLAYDGPDRKVYANRLVYPRAFFVSRYEVAPGIEILKKIAAQSFNPRDVAYFMEDPGLKLDPALPTSSVEVTQYGIQDLSLDVTAAGNNLLFLSEAYYPEGWKALLDGSEVPIYRVNYMFRGVVIPPGSHKLEMRFEPKMYSLGKNLSLGTNLILVILFGIVAVQSFRKKGNSNPE
jgi:hypothetical protein